MGFRCRDGRSKFKSVSKKQPALIILFAPLWQWQPASVIFEYSCYIDFIYPPQKKKLFMQSFYRVGQKVIPVVHILQVTCGRFGLWTFWTYFVGSRVGPTLHDGPVGLRPVRVTPCLDLHKSLITLSYSYSY